MACVPRDVVLLPSVVHGEFRCAPSTAQQSSKERLPLTASGKRSGGDVQVAADHSLDALEALPFHVPFVVPGMKASHCSRGLRRAFVRSTPAS